MMKNTIALKILFIFKLIALVYIGIVILRYTSNNSSPRTEKIVVTDVNCCTTNYGRNVTGVNAIEARTPSSTKHAVEEKIEKREMLYESRRRLVERSCHQLGHTFKTERNFGRILVDRSHKVMYCQVPKVGCSNWLRVFLKLTGDYSPEEYIPWSEVAYIERYYKRLSQYRGKEFEEMTRPGNYTKFMVVRHPFSRLLSAFLNKFVHRTSQQLLLEMMEKIHNVTGSTAQEINFHDFVQYLIMTDEKSETWNNHYRPMYHLCSPCDIDYDIIGHLETINEDAQYIIKTIGSDLDYPSRDQSATNSSNSDKMIEYFGKLSKYQIIQLYRIYQMDFALFGYSVPDYMNVTIS
ncbi:carbohydrate sulfotransferase 11-like [Ptychodera flava]|uniref:carbohydrate sulfotransferase 11-like n=1 Tax=Ptychodera flava TaxID=63121 RepID=UPI003969EFBD